MRGRVAGAKASAKACDAKHRFGKTGLRVVAGSLLAVFALAGCHADLQEAQQSFRDGQYQQAAVGAQGYMDDHIDDEQSTLAYLEAGSMHLVAGNYQQSHQALLAAENRFVWADEREASKVGQAIKAAVTNPMEAPYLGKPVDRVMAPVFRAIDLLCMGQTDAARQALFASEKWQQWAIEHHAKRIAAAEADDSKASQVGQSDAVQSQLNALYGDLSVFEAYEGYANPFADLLLSVYLMGTQTDRSDGELARNHMRRVAGMVPDSKWVQSTLQRADQASGGEKQPPALHVFVLTGVTPSMETERLDIPVSLLVGGNNLDYFGVAFPRLVHHNNYVHGASFVVGNGSGVTRSNNTNDPASGMASTEMVTDVERMVVADFKAGLPELVTRTMSGAITKAGATYAINQSLRGQDDLVGAVVRIGALVYQITQNQADIRTWASLPKQIHYGRIDDLSGPITVQGQNGEAWWHTQGIDPNVSHLLFVRSVRPGAPVWVEHVALP